MPFPGSFIQMAASEAISDKFHAALRELYRLQRFGIKLELSTIRRMLAQLGNPQQTYAAVHIAGTNGKGSVAAALASILTSAGYRTGLYTSPHLVCFNERICIDGRQVTDEEVLSAYRTVKQVDPGERQPTFFEYTTAMALYLFAQRRVQWAVIETGMGGRLDATNVLAPAVTVITNVALEHRAYLGSRLAQIAAEKAGIIKPQTPVITAVHQPAAIAVIEKTAAAKDAPLFRLKTHFGVRRSGNGTFCYRGMHHRWPAMHTPLQGGHQVENAALTLAACEILKNSGNRLPREAIRTGLARTRWPGRLEIVRADPLVILDGAHNLIAARRLAGYLAAELKDRPVTLVAGILDDKPYAAMLRCLVPLCRRIVLTRPVIDRALPPSLLLREVKKLGAAATVIEAVPDAVHHAITSAAPHGAVCVAGSLYTVGEARQYLNVAGGRRA